MFVHTWYVDLGKYIAYLQCCDCMHYCARLLPGFNVLFHFQYRLIRLFMVLIGMVQFLILKMQIMLKWQQLESLWRSKTFSTCKLQSRQSVTVIVMGLIYSSAVLNFFIRNLHNETWFFIHLVFTMSCIPESIF